MIKNIALLFLLLGCQDRTPSTLTIDIKGMHCDACVQSITHEVLSIDGVIDCSVSLEEEKAVIIIDESSIQPEIVNAIQSLKFTAIPVSK